MIFFIPLVQLNKILQNEIHIDIGCTVADRGMKKNVILSLESATLAKDTNEFLKPLTVV